MLALSDGAKQCLGYHLFFILENVYLLDATAFAYAWGIRIEENLPTGNEQSCPNETMEEIDENHCDVRDVSKQHLYVLRGDDISDDES